MSKCGGVRAQCMRATVVAMDGALGISKSSDDIMNILHLTLCHNFFFFQLCSPTLSLSVSTLLCGANNNYNLCNCIDHRS